MSTINAPTIVRLIRFPKSLRLEKKGSRYFGPLKRSGPLILSERHDPVECTFRLNDPGLSFATGGNTVQGVEAYNEGEQRDLLLPWALVSDGKARPAKILMEIDVNYEGSAEKHTATVPLDLTYGVRRRVVGAVAAGAAAAAVAVAAVARKRKKKTAASSSRKAAAKKASAKKRAPAKKAAAKKQAPAKKAGGARRESAPSRSAPRKGARGSSKARKAAPRRTTRKSR